MLEVLGLSKSEVDKLKDIPHDELLIAEIRPLPKSGKASRESPVSGGVRYSMANSYPIRPEIRGEMPFQKMCPYLLVLRRQSLG